MNKLFLTTIMLLMACFTMTFAQNAGLPLEPGMAVATGFSGEQDGQELDGVVLRIFDPRDPVARTAPMGSEWTTAQADGYNAAGWVASEMGEVFGIALEEGNVSDPDIYVASHGIVADGQFLSVYPKGGPSGGSTGGEVYKVDGNSGAVTTLGIVQSQVYSNDNDSTRYTGVGQITFNRFNRVLYATSLDDGKIYVIDVDGGGVQSALTFDPGMALSTPVPDTTSYVFTQAERAAFGLGYNDVENRLYYSLMETDWEFSTKGGWQKVITGSSVYSVAINAATGGISGTPKFEFTIAESVPVSDFSFSMDGKKMLVSTMSANYRNFEIEVSKFAHGSPVFRYEGSSSSWTLALTYSVGQASLGSKNSSGGSDFGFNNYGVNDGNSNLEDAAVMMSDAIKFNAGDGKSVYGIQISDYAGDTYTAQPDDSYWVDFDNEVSGTGNFDKYLLGDTEVYPGYPDLGDLPDLGDGTGAGDSETEWDSDGAYHFINEDIMIGSSVDQDVNGQPNSGATGDDADGNDDEDGVTAFPTFTPGTQVCMNIPVVNNTGEVAFFYAFFDFNGDGDFGDAGETVTIAVPNGATSVNVCPTVPTTGFEGDMMVRFRLTTEDLSDRSGTSELWEGGASDGEVEDYIVPVVLPIELVDFTGEYNKEEKKVDLIWTVAMEENVKMYELERSYDGENFEVFYTERDIANSVEMKTYYAEDRDMELGGNIYYRLKATDWDGAFEYSNTVLIKMEEEIREFEVYPNPASSRVMIDVEEDGMLEIYSQNGRKMFAGEVAPGANSVNLSEFSNGLYFIKYTVGDQVVAKRLMIQQ